MREINIKQYENFRDGRYKYPILMYNIKGDEILIYGEEYSEHTKVNEIEIYGLQLYDYTKNIVISDCFGGCWDAEWCIVRRKGNNIEIVSKEYLPSGKNWEWQETISGKIVIDESKNIFSLERTIFQDTIYTTQSDIDMFLDEIEKYRDRELSIKDMKYDDIEGLPGKLYYCSLLGYKKVEEVIINFNKYFYSELDGLPGELLQICQEKLKNKSYKM